MPTEDVLADDARAAGGADLPASADTAAIAFASAAPLHPRWLRPTIASAVILAHALAVIALANVARPAPPAEETIEVNIVAAGDEAPVTTSAAQAPSESASEAASQQSKAPNEPAPQPPATESAPALETPPVVAEEPTPSPASEPSARPDAPPPVEAAQPPAPEPPPSSEPPKSLEAQIEPPLPPPDVPPPEAAQAPAPKPSPDQPTPASVEAQMQPLPPPPDPPPPIVAALTPALAPPTSVEVQRQPSPAPPAPPEQIRTQPQPRPKQQARLEPAERPKPRAKPEMAERPTPRKPIEGGSGAGAKASSAKPGSAEAHHVGEANGQAADVGMSRASYAALVVAQIQAHKFYPDSARSRGDQGAVGVSFTIGPSGRVGSASVVRSSGFAELDSAARQILQSISPPPPPGGSFSASTTIRFHFE